MATKKKAGKKKAKKKAKRKAAERGGARKKAAGKKAGGPGAAPPERGAPPPPGAGPERGAPDERVKLEDFLVACQKSLARSAHAAEHASRAESEFAHGDRNLFMIDGLDLDLSAGLSMSFKADGGGESRPHAVMLDFSAAEDERSRLRFRVETKPLELLEGASLQLANLDPLGDILPDAHLRVWLVDARGEEVPGHEVNLQFMPAGTRDPSRLTTLPLTTDMAGRVNFWLRPRGDTLVVEVVGDQAYRRRVLRDDVAEYLLWVECEMRDAPGRPIALKTEVLRLPAR